MRRNLCILFQVSGICYRLHGKVPCTVVKGVYCVEVKQGSNLYGQNVSKRYIQERWLKCQVDFWPGQCIIDAEIKQGSDIVGKKNAEKI